MADVNKLKEFLESPAGSDFTLRYFKELKEKQQKKKDYYDSGNLDADLYELVEWLKSRNMTGIATDGVFYTESHAEMSKLTNLIRIIESLNTVKFEDFKEHNDSMFPEVTIEYNDVALSMTFGQGTMFSIEIR